MPNKRSQTIDSSRNWAKNNKKTDKAENKLFQVKKGNGPSPAKPKQPNWLISSENKKYREMIKKSLKGFKVTTSGSEFW